MSVGNYLISSNQRFMRLVGFQSVGSVRQLMLRLPVVWHGLTPKAWIPSLGPSAGSQVPEMSWIGAGAAVTF